MEKKGRILWVDGHESPLENTSLESLQQIVGGYIEIVSLPNTDDVFIVNEDGYTLKLPTNEIATRVLKNYYAKAGTIGDVFMIVGNAIICNKSLLD